MVATLCESAPNCAAEPGTRSDDQQVPWIDGRNILSRLGHGITLLNEQQAPVAGFPHSPFLRPQARMASRKPLVPAEDGPRGRRKAAATCPAVRVEMLEALLRPVS